MGLRNHNVKFSGPSSFDILEGHSKATMLLIANNAAQGILSSFFFKYAGNNMFTYLLNVFKDLFYLIKFFITYKKKLCI